MDDVLTGEFAQYILHYIMVGDTCLSTEKRRADQKTIVKVVWFRLRNLPIMFFITLVIIVNSRSWFLEVFR